MDGCFNSLAFLSMQELLVILLIAILIFGAARIPEIARSLGRAIREFKKGTHDDVDAKMPDKPGPTEKDPGNAPKT